MQYYFFQKVVDPPKKKRERRLNFTPQTQTLKLNIKTEQLATLFALGGTLLKKVTIETNSIIALENREKMAPYIDELIQMHNQGEINLGSSLFRVMKENWKPSNNPKKAEYIFLERGVNPCRTPNLIPPEIQ